MLFMSSKLLIITEERKHKQTLTHYIMHYYIYSNIYIYLFIYLFIVRVETGVLIQ